MNQMVAQEAASMDQNSEAQETVSDLQTQQTKLTAEKENIQTQLDAALVELKELQEKGESGQNDNSQDQAEFAKILKEQKLSWKEKNQKIKDDFKELLKEFEAL